MIDATRRKREGWPPRLSEIEGLRARLRKAWPGIYYTVPAGTLVTIGRAPSMWSRITVNADKCGHCGVAPRMQLSWRSLELVRDDLVEAAQAEGAE